MIPQLLMNIVFNIVEKVLEVLPDFSWSVENTFFTTALDMLQLACYLLPMGTIITLIAIVFFMINFRIAISIIKTIWDILPIL